MENRKAAFLSIFKITLPVKVLMRVSLGILLVIASQPLFASGGVGGSGGGTQLTDRLSRRVTIEVCDGGESGTLCRTVTYIQEPPTAVNPNGFEQCVVSPGEAGEAPCPEKYGIPKWLKKFSDYFERQLRDLER